MVDTGIVSQVNLSFSQRYTDLLPKWYSPTANLHGTDDLFVDVDEPGETVENSMREALRDAIGFDGV